MRKLLLFGVTAGTVAMALPGAALAHGGPPVDVFTDTVSGSEVISFTGPWWRWPRNGIHRVP